MKLSRRRILAIYNATESLVNIKSVKVAYAIAKNRRTVLQPVIDALQDIQKPSAELLEFEKSRIALCTSFSHGKIEAGNYIIAPEEKEEFDKAMAELVLQYEKAIDDGKNKNKEVEDFLDGEEDVNLHTVSLDDLSSAFAGVDLKTIVDIYDMVRE